MERHNGHAVGLTSLNNFQKGGEISLEERDTESGGMKLLF